MISISLNGVDEVIQSVLMLPKSIDSAAKIEQVAADFASRLRAATPVGYSGRLKDSVMYSSSSDGVEVGYEEGVETAGGDDLGPVLSASTKGRSVIRRKKWVKAGELEAILQETFDSYADEATTVLEESLVSGIS